MQSEDMTTKTGIDFAKDHILAWSKTSKGQRVIRLVFCAFFMILFVMAFTRWVLVEGADEKAFASSPLGFIAGFGITLILMRAWPPPMDWPSRVTAGIISFLFSLALIVSSNLIYKGSSNLLSLGTWLGTFMMLPCLYVLFARVVVFLGASKRGISLGDIKTRQFSPLTKRQFFIIWAIIIICWFPMLLITWPGAYYYDVAFQTQFLVTGEGVWAHHPILHSLWVALPMQLSYNLVGDYEPGYFFYTVTQMIVVSFIYAQAVRIISRWRIPRWSGILCIIVFAIFPGFSTWSVVSTKDVTFLALFCVCFAQLLDLFIINTEDQTYRRRKLVIFWISLFLLFMFRNNMAYGFALFTVLTILFYKGKRLQTAAFTLSLLIVYALVTGPLYEVLGVVPGGKQEMMSVPAVQLARVANVAADDLTDEQLSFIQTYVPTWYDYNENLADSVKFPFDVYKAFNEPLAFLEGYLSIGFKHPLVFTDAVMRLSIGYWAPWVDFEKEDTTLNELSPFAPFVSSSPSEEWPEDKFIYIQQSPKLPRIMVRGEHFFAIRHLDQRIPGLASLYQTGTWIWFMVLIAAMCVLQRRWKLLLASMFFFCYWFTLFLGPISIYRYSNVVFVCALLMILVLTKWRAGVCDSDRKSEESY